MSTKRRTAGTTTPLIESITKGIGFIMKAPVFFLLDINSDNEQYAENDNNFFAANVIDTATFGLGIAAGALIATSGLTIVAMAL